MDDSELPTSSNNAAKSHFGLRAQLPNLVELTMGRLENDIKDANAMTISKKAAA